MFEAVVEARDRATLLVVEAEVREGSKRSAVRRLGTATWAKVLGMHVSATGI